MSDLISRTTRGLFRDLMTSSTIGEIGAAFQDELFAPNPDSTYQDSSVRRTLTQEYLESVDWADVSHVNRALRVFERLALGFEPQYSSRFLNSLRRDGYVLDEETGHITAFAPRFAPDSLKNVSDASAIRQQLGRIQHAILDDPALAIGSAKELIESTAKIILKERGLHVDDRADLPALVRDAQQALGLHPSAAVPGPDGSDAVKKILGSVSGIAIGLAELRNRGYGTGHGPAQAPSGLGARHAHLAVNAAFTWCQLMLDTLADPKAPWRKGSGASALAAWSLPPATSGTGRPGSACGPMSPRELSCSRSGATAAAPAPRAPLVLPDARRPVRGCWTVPGACPAAPSQRVLGAFPGRMSCGR